MKKHDRIGVVGLSCKLPGAATIQQLWERVSNRKRAVGPLPVERFDANLYRSCWGMETNGTVLGGLVEIPEIDFRSLPIPPAQIRHLHPMEKVGLSILHEALQDAGIEMRSNLAAKGRIYVAATTVGASPETDHGPRIRQGEFTDMLRTALEAVDPTVARGILDQVSTWCEQHTPPILPETMTTSASLFAGRIANLYDIHGGHVAIDAGVCSSFAAIEEAIRALQQRSCDFALVAAVSPLISASSLLEYAGDSSFANQLPVLGEGGVALVLMREENIGERGVYGYIDGIGSAVIANRTNEYHIANAAKKAAAFALKQAGVSAGDIMRIESRNSGLSFWEKAEQDGLSQVYPIDSSRDGLAVTSAVPYVGYLQAAAGLVAMVNGMMEWSKSNSSRPQLLAVSDCGIAPVAYHAIVSSPTTETRQADSSSEHLHEPIAIVGMGVIVPGAPNRELFWKHTTLGYRSIGDLPAWKWSYEKIIGTNPALRSLSPSKLAGVVQVPDIDPQQWGMTHEEMSRLDGGVILSLLSSWEAAQQARLTDAPANKQRVDVIYGQLPVREAENAKNKLTYFTDFLKLVRSTLLQNGVSATKVEELTSALLNQYRSENALGIDYLAAGTGLTNSHAVARALGMEGKILSVDAACASSLAAVEMAVRRLQANEADAVVVGGVAHHLVPEYNVTLQVLGALSSNGIPPFHDDSDGFTPAEGAGTIVVKRLSDALRDHNQIFAVLTGVGQSSDGKGASVFAPNSQGQQRAIEAALKQAAVLPDDLDHIEAHGTGTRLGDATEIQTYQAVFGERHKYKPYSIGAIKSQIGHLSSAAGIIGLIKTALSLHEKVIPPSYVDARSPVLLTNLATRARMWESREDRKRKAGVSAFGMGGINYFVVLEEYQEQRGDERERETQPLLSPLHPLKSDRFIVELVPASLPRRPALFSLAGKRIVLVKDAASKWKVCKPVLEQRGARVYPLDPSPWSTEQDLHLSLTRWEHENGELTGVIDLRMVAERPELPKLGTEQLAREMEQTSDFTFWLLRFFYDRFEQAAPLTCCYIAVTAMGGNLGLTDCDNGNVLGAFLQGMLKSLKQELPSVLAKTVDFPAHEPIENVTSLLLDEIEDGNERMEVAYTDSRFVVAHKQASFSSESPLARPIRKDDVYVFSGGGRGVVFECATALALLGATVIVCGRTRISDSNARWLSLDQEEFSTFSREQLVKSREQNAAFSLPDWKRSIDRMSRERELYQNLKKAEQLGISYEICDITNESEVHALIRRIVDKHGRIDGIVHGAMVEWSMSLPKKTKEMIDNTLRTKVIGMCHLLEATKELPIRSFVCFGSGAGRFGNKGQTDYSAANSLMSALLVAKNRERKQPIHHTTLNWTAWEAVGAAVSDPAITDVLKRNGVPFAPPEEGIHWFLSELTLGRDTETLNVAEDFLKNWPFGSVEADGTGERALSFTDRGTPIHPWDWPYIDTLLVKSAGKVVVERTVEPAKDTYLAQHCLDQIPIFPMVCYLELLAEAAAVTSMGWSLHTVRNFEVFHACKLYEGKPVTLRAAAFIRENAENERVIVSNVLSDLTVNGRILQKDRVNASASFVFRKQPPLLERKEIPAVSGESRSSVHYSLQRDTLQIGPIFCRASNYTVNQKEGVALADPANERNLFSFTNAPAFQTDPFTVDVAMQIGVTVDSFQTGIVSLPISIATIRFGRKRGQKERVQVYSRIIHEEGTDMTYDIDVTGENGDTIMELHGFLARRITR